MQSHDDVTPGCKLDNSKEIFNNEEIRAMYRLKHNADSKVTERESLQLFQRIKSLNKFKQSANNETQKADSKANSSTG